MQQIGQRAVLGYVEGHIGNPGSVFRQRASQVLQVGVIVPERQFLLDELHQLPRVFPQQPLALGDSVGLGKVHRLVRGLKGRENDRIEKPETKNDNQAPVPEGSAPRTKSFGLNRRLAGHRVQPCLILHPTTAYWRRSLALPVSRRKRPNISATTAPCRTKTCCDRWNPFQPGLWQDGCQAFGQLQRMHRVIGPGDDAGRHVQAADGREVLQDDPVDHGAQGRDQAPLLVGVPHAAGRFDDLLRLPSILGHALFDALEILPHTQRLYLRRLGGQKTEVWMRPVAENRSGKQHSLHPLRAPQGKEQGNRGAHGFPVNHGFLDAQRVEDRPHILGHAVRFVQSRVDHRG